MVKLRQFGEKAWSFIMNPIERDAKITFLEGSVRSSKTFTMHPKLLSLLQFGPTEGIPIITGVSKTTIYDNILRDLFEITGPGTYDYNRQTGDLNLYGRQLKVVGAKDEGSEKYILGKTIPWAYADEVVTMPEGFFRQLLLRLSPPGSRLYCTTNPGPPTHFLHKEFIQDKAKQESGMVRVIHFDLDDNPNLSEEYKTFIRSSYKGVYYQRYVLGLWVMAEGGIYKDCWSDDLIFTDETVKPGLYDQRGYADRWICNDYGTDHPHVYYDMMDDGHTVWVVREWVWDSREQLQQKTDSQYADDLEEFLKGDPDRGIPDASHHEIIVPPEAASFKAELRNRGLWITDADNDVSDGIRLVSSMMSLKRVRVHESCTRLINGIRNYSWDGKAAKRGEEKPLKQDDDETDAFRYGLKTKIKPWRMAA